jgi:hypothetical protein
MNRVYLDLIYRDSLERLAVQEGLITHARSLGGSDQPIFVSRRQDERNLLRRKTLRLLMLFDTVDSDFSGLDWAEGIKAGFVDKHANIAGGQDEGYDLRDRVLGDGPLLEERKRLVRYAVAAAMGLVRTFKRQIIQRHIRVSEPGFYFRTPKKFVSPRDLDDDFEFVFHDVLNDTQQTVNEKPHLMLLHGELSLQYMALRDCIYHAAWNRSMLASAFNLPQLPEITQVSNLVDDVYYLASASLREDGWTLPAPRTLAEAVEIRGSPFVKRFREVMNEWILTLQEGRIDAAKRIRRDVLLANRELERLERWERFERSPVLFWINAVGGQVPILSNFLSAVATVAGLGSSAMKRHSGWVMLLQRPARLVIQR